MKLISVAQMRAIEQEANAAGLSYAQMLQNAGQALAQVIAGEFKDDLHVLFVVGLVGSGNNGGDTLVALGELVSAGWFASVYLTGTRPPDDPLLQSLIDRHIQIVSCEQDPDFETLDELLSQADVLLDGVLGIGAQLPLRPELARILGHISGLATRPPVVAVDCPSGVDCDSGACAPQVIPATLTVCMLGVKQGLLRPPAFEYTGKLRTVDIGLPTGLKTMAALHHQVVTQAQVAELLPVRSKFAHKGTFGSALIAAGSINFTGAAFLAGKAAYRSGAGLVRMAVPGALHTALAGSLPEVTWLLLPHQLGVIAEAAAEVLLKNLEKASALLIGPGFGLEDTTRGFIKQLLGFGKKAGPGQGAAGFGFLTQAEAQSETGTAGSPELPPLVIDADALKLLAKFPDWAAQLPPLCVLTPHPGEMAILTGLSVEEIQADRIETAVRYAGLWNQVVVLKGAITVIAAPGQGARLIPVATAALARAGTGDVLSGITVSLLAQGLPPFDAATAAAWLHAFAGLEAEHYLDTPTSVLASDVLEAIPAVFASLQR
jgi:NAD(P)H-hydrate epimerase